MLDLPMLRTSERKSFANCRQQWWWSYVECWESSDPKPALRFGDLIHQSLAGWYPKGRKRGVKPWLTFEKRYNEQLEAGADEFDVFNDDERFDAMALGTEMLRNYVERWGEDEDWEVIAPEMPFQVLVRDKKGRPWFYYVGNTDICIKIVSSGRLGFVETKTASSISTRHLSMDEQASSYWGYGPLFLQEQGILKKGQDIDFVLYNFLRKAFKDTRPRDAQGRPLNKPKKPDLLLACAEHVPGPVGKGATVETLMRLLEGVGIDPNQYGEPSKSIPPPLFDRTPVYRDTVDREHLFLRVKQQMWEMELVKAGKLPVYKNPSATWPNQTCNGCEFVDVCEMHETGGNWEELARLTMVTWDPYMEHREGVAS